MHFWMIQGLDLELCSVVYLLLYILEKAWLSRAARVECKLPYNLLHGQEEPQRYPHHSDFLCCCAFSFIKNLVH